MAIVVVDALVKQQLGFHRTNYGTTYHMASSTIFSLDPHMLRLDAHPDEARRDAAQERPIAQ
jgi:hypothetical protein